MNLPAGTPVKEGLDIASVDFLSLVSELARKRFNGYVCITTAGRGGFEEGTLVFDEGKPVASIYEYYAYRKSYFGEHAFKRIVNSSAAATGVLDIFELSNEQIRLVLAFNENAISVPGSKDLEPRSIIYSSSFEDEAKAGLVGTTKDELLRKWRMSDALSRPSGEPALTELDVGGDDLLKPLFKEGSG